MLTTDYAHRAAQNARKRQEEIDRKTAIKAARERAKRMSDVRWCEANGWEKGHPFSAKDPNAERITRQHTESKYRGNSYGSPVIQPEEVVDEFYDICGPCKAKFGLFQTGNQAKEIAPKRDREYDPEYVENLIEENAKLDKLLGEATGRLPLELRRVS